jgi:hypothetical protein
MCSIEGFDTGYVFPISNVPNDLHILLADLDGYIEILHLALLKNLEGGGITLYISDVLCILV